jgi:hypothetical protein
MRDKQLSGFVNAGVVVDDDAQLEQLGYVVSVTCSRLGGGRETSWIDDYAIAVVLA